MSENLYELDSLNNQAYCAACDGELKTGARFCSRCGQPATEAIHHAVNGNLFDATTRRLAIPGCEVTAIKAQSRKTQRLKPFPAKRRGYQLLAVSLAANCVLVMAFAYAVSRAGFLSPENVSPLIAGLVTPEDGEIFFDSGFETAFEEAGNAVEKRVVRACAVTPALEVEPPLRAAQPSGVGRGDDEAAKKSVTVKAERALQEMQESRPPNARPSGFVENGKARRNVRNEARPFKMSATFNTEELSRAAADFNFEMHRLPAALQTALGEAQVKAQIEIRRAKHQATLERRKRRVAESTRVAKFATVSCGTMPNAPDAVPNAPEVPNAAPTFVIKAETLERLGM